MDYVRHGKIQDRELQKRPNSGPVFHHVWHSPLWVPLWHIPLGSRNKVKHKIPFNITFLGRAILHIFCFYWIKILSFNSRLQYWLFFRAKIQKYFCSCKWRLRSQLYSELGAQPEIQTLKVIYQVRARNGNFKARPQRGPICNG